MPPVAATQQMPAQAAPPAYNEAAYQQQYAQPAYQQPQQPPRKKKTGLIIAIVAVVFVLLACAVVGAVVAFRSLADNVNEVTTQEPVISEEPAEADGYASAEEALAATYSSDWVFELQWDDGDIRTYWAGPPNSEFTDEVVVERSASGMWSVTQSVALEFGEPGLLPEDEAVATVMNFLDLIMQDRPLEAQQLCVPPFSEDPASAQYSNGDFIGYDIEGVTAEDDMTFWVHTVEEWRWGVEEFEYWVVPTELGYFIADLRPY